MIEMEVDILRYGQYQQMSIGAVIPTGAYLQSQVRNEARACRLP